MAVRITTLIDNTAGYGFLGEWGLSMLLEADGRKILMDSGQSISTLHNADRLGINLAEIDCIVLSHGHFDHTRCLEHVLSRTGEIEIVAHPDIWAPKYVRRSPTVIDYIGMSNSREDLESRGARFRLTREPFAITKNIMTTGEIEMVNGYEKIEGNLLVKEGEGFAPDNLADDLALEINAECGLIIMLGCAHRGMINSIRQAQRLTGNRKVYAVLGGTHLIFADEARMSGTISDLKEIGVTRLGVSHCTGFNTSTQLAQAFPESFFLNMAGTRLTFP